MLERFVKANRRIAGSLSRAVSPRIGRVDGRQEFLSHLLPDHLSRGMRVLDVGGGKLPAVSSALKTEFDLHVTGMDIDPDEFLYAPEEAYDSVIVGDISGEVPTGSYDLILSVSVLEHVDSPARALANMARVLEPGGTMLHMLPCRFAPFAIVSRLLGPERSKRVLCSVYPDAAKYQGFPARYVSTYPSAMRRLARENGLEIEALRPFYCSDYASFFLPLYVLDYSRQAIFKAARLSDLCENFALVLRKPLGPAESGFGRG